MQYKVGIKEYTEVEYDGELYPTSRDYWTTVEAQTERQAKLLARDNLLIKIAKTEIWTWGNVRKWKHLFIDLSDMVIGE